MIPELNGKEIKIKGRVDIGIRIAGSPCCTVETNTTLKRTYSRKKLKPKKKVTPHGFRFGGGEGCFC